MAGTAASAASASPRPPTEPRELGRVPTTLTTCQGMRTNDALAVLREMLAAVGFDEREPHLAVLWPAVKEWAAMPAEASHDELTFDGLLFECTLDLKPRTAAPQFTVDLARHFSFDDHLGDYRGMERVGVDLGYAVHDEFREITTMADWAEDFGTADKLWGRGGPAAADWAVSVEASRSYQTALRHSATRFGWSSGPA